MQTACASLAYRISILVILATGSERQMVTFSPSVYHTVFETLNRMMFGNLPAFVAVAAVIERFESILFVDRSDGLGLSLPGGIVKWGETCENALKREVREETGYKIAITGFMGVYSSLHRDPRFSCVEIVYAGIIVGGNERSSSEGQIIWTHKTCLPSTLGFDHELVMRDYLKMTTRSYQ
jgi:ADP-ribose pyrophosphatase YjhB (NUDIX family)